MTPDPYFTDVDQWKGARTRRRRWFRRVLATLLLLSGAHMIGTGSPIPLWYIESLNRPVAVTAIDSGALVLADGRQIRLPFIKKLPRDDPAFVRAVSRGVELGDDGRVVGLIEPCRWCGNDPVVYRRLRIDLSELAGILDPGAIDDAIVPPDSIRDVKDYFSQPRDRREVPYNWMSQASRLRHIYKSARSRRAPERSSPTPIASTAPR